MTHYTPLGEFESIDEFVAEILRRKSPEERLALEKSKRRSVIDMLTAYLKSEHPEWNEHQIAAEICRRIPTEERSEWRDFLPDEGCDTSSLNK